MRLLALLLVAASTAAAGHPLKMPWLGPSTTDCARRTLFDAFDQAQFLPEPPAFDAKQRSDLVAVMLSRYAPTPSQSTLIAVIESTTGRAWLVAYDYASDVALWYGQASVHADRYRGCRHSAPPFRYRLAEPAATKQE